MKKIQLLLMLICCFESPSLAASVSPTTIIEESAKHLNFYAHISKILWVLPWKWYVEVEKTDNKQLDLFIKEITKRDKNLKVRNINSKKGLPLSQDDTFSFEVEVIDTRSDGAEPKDEKQEHPEVTTPKKVTGLNKCHLTRGDLEPYLKKEKDVASDARGVPYYLNGKIHGYKILSVHEGGYLYKLGLVRGDLVFKVNGRQIDVENFSDRLLDVKNGLKIELERDGKKLTQKCAVK